jgi:hypothetical protein
VSGWGGSRNNSGRKLDPETIEWRKWCRRLLREKKVRARIRSVLTSKKTDDATFNRTLHEVVSTAHPTPTELSGVIEIGGGIRVHVNAAKFGVVM